ncbi:unnamed protein product [Adineta ricciae]|uniref:Uncharacterized protein n=1 Tax=Adineta ricciae TaxID=249248 RepID=A0A813NIT0_ADIRI|nr:unnamed protein product [Adineta ricciae]CAF1342949.1 unnamed protein product [Adineta ricciae]
MQHPIQNRLDVNPYEQNTSKHQENQVFDPLQEPLFQISPLPKTLFGLKFKQQYFIPLHVSHVHSYTTATPQHHLTETETDPGPSSFPPSVLPPHIPPVPDARGTSYFLNHSERLYSQASFHNYSSFPCASSR